ncbi:MAG TPA: NADH-quinone oxidoreductase subunit C [Terriglobales bacterium]|nr:NADH-quinone oxidoreductase subunit C [Terriglobales bacterium]
MSDENKDKVSPPQPGAGAPADQPRTPPAATPPAAKPAAAAAPPAAGAAPPKPAAPAKPAGPAPTPWEHERVAKLRKQYGSGIQEASTYLGQNYMVVDKSILHEVLRLLRDDEQFDYLVDLTAVHYPKREASQFDIVYVLYSFPKNERMRVKTQLKEGEDVPSAVPLWPTSNWLERECFDMFGIRFEGHPDLRRILLPDEWKGYPLRKDYGIIQQDQEWVKINLGIESGQ